MTLPKRPDTWRYPTLALVALGGVIKKLGTSLLGMLQWVPVVNLVATIGLGWFTLQWKATQDKDLEVFKNDLHSAHLVLNNGFNQARHEIRASDVAGATESAGVVNTSDGTALAEAGNATSASTPPVVSLSFIVYLRNVQGAPAENVEIDLEATDALITVEPRFPHAEIVQFSADHRQAAVKIKQLAVGEDYALFITAKEAGPSDTRVRPESATGMFIHAYCQNCVADVGL